MITAHTKNHKAVTAEGERAPAGTLAWEPTGRGGGAAARKRPVPPNPTAAPILLLRLKQPKGPSPGVKEIVQ